METPLVNRREMLKKIIGVSVGTTVAQVLGVGQSLTAISALAESSNSENVNVFNIAPRLNYDFLSPIAKGIGGGIGEFSYSIGDAGAKTVRGAGEAGGDIFRGIGEGVRERLRDFFSNAEGKRKLQEYSLQQNFERKREIAQLMRDSLREYQAKQIDLKLTEIQSNWDLQNWNSILSRKETEDLLKDKKDSLLILLSPPEISPDAPASIRNNLKSDLSDLEVFLAKYYPNRDKQHSVKFYSDYFKNPIGNINVEQLQKILAPVPTAILDLDVTDYTYTVKVHFWAIKNNELQFYSSNVWNWENGTKELMSKGADEKDALRMIRQTIVNSNKFLVAYIADLYYLNLDPYYQIQFPKIAAELQRSGLDGKWLRPYNNKLQDIQQTEQQVYERELQVFANEVKEEKSITANAQKWKLASTLAGESYFTLLAFSPNRQIIASGSGNKTIKLLDVNGGQLLRTIEGHSDWVFSVAFSPNGQIIASGSEDKTIKLWDVNTGQLFRTLEGHSDGVASVVFSPNGQIIASGSGDKTIKLWDVNTGQLLRTLEGHSDGVVSVAFSPNGQIIASGSGDKTIKLWDVNTGQLLRTLEGHSDGVVSVAFSPSRQIIASGSYDKTIKLWNLNTGKLLRTLEGHSAWLISVVYSPDGHTLASDSGDMTVQIWRDN
jgi:WD40 repeat protein